MISNDDVSKFYHSLDLPGVYGQHPLTLQIFRGISAYRRAGQPGKCERHHAVFQKYEVIPEYCFGCYKVYIQPRTVVELFKLLLLFEKIDLPNNNLRKCMTEIRADTSGTYKGYVFSRGTEEGTEVCDIVREAVAREISPDISVVLKRGCSEFSAVFPTYSPTDPSIEPLKYDESWRVHEENFDKNVAYTQPPVTAADSGVNDGVRRPYTPAEVYAMTYWLLYAATIGDDSYIPIACGILPPLPNLKRPPFVKPAPTSA